MPTDRIEISKATLERLENEWRQMRDGHPVRMAPQVPPASNTSLTTAA